MAVQSPRFMQRHMLTSGATQSPYWWNHRQVCRLVRPRQKNPAQNLTAFKYFFITGYMLRRISMSP